MFLRAITEKREGSTRVKTPNQREEKREKVYSRPDLSEAKAIDPRFKYLQNFLECFVGEGGGKRLKSETPYQQKNLEIRSPKRVVAFA